MRKPHKHADVIKAWADGAEIEVKTDITKKWIKLEGYAEDWAPQWLEANEYRVKQEPKSLAQYLFETLTEAR